MKRFFKKVVFVVAIQIAMWAMEDPAIRGIVDKAIAESIQVYMVKEVRLNDDAEM